MGISEMSDIELNQWFGVIGSILVIFNIIAIIYLGISIKRYLPKLAIRHSS